MVKFSLLTALLFNSSSAFELIQPHKQLQKDESSRVFNILKQFITLKQPLNIGYLGSEHETLSTKTTVVTQAVKQSLKKIDSIFTDQCLNKISLGDTNMILGGPVKVPLFYRFKNYEGSYVKIDIYIRERQSPLQKTAVTIANKIKLELHLKNFCYQQMMDSPAVVKDIRQGLVGQKVLSFAEAQYVQPEDIFIISKNKYRLRVIKDGKTAYSQPILFIINRYSKIIHWECTDNILHFIAYFTSGDYIVLKKVLNAIPADWFLGAFIQILNDGEFIGGVDSTFCIPELREIAEYTAAYRHIFRWDNRLDRYMSHFGFWFDDQVSTADSMVRLKRCESDHCNHNKICNGASVLRDWLKQWLKSHSEHQNNNGVMMNLKWEYTTDHLGWTMYSFNYWDASALW